MTATAELFFLNSPLPIFPTYKSKVWWLCLIMAILLAALLGGVSVYASGFGGLISEKLIDRSGVANSNPLIGRGGVSNPEIDMAMSGVAVVTGVTNIYMDGAGTHATLNGNLQSLRGFPSVVVYFQWGYDGVYTSVTAPQTTGATGAFSADIAHYDPGRTVYYRAVVQADGRNFSSPSTFIGEGIVSSGFNLLNATVVIIYTAMVLLAVIALGSRSTIAALILAAVAALMGQTLIVTIQNLLNSVF